MSTPEADILIADDDDLVRSAYMTVLERAGYRVFLAGDGFEAIALLERQKVDILLLDIVMPNKDGIETLIEARRRFPDLTIFAMSGGTNRYVDFLDVASKFGATATLKKPFRARTLLNLIKGSRVNSRAGAA